VGAMAAAAILVTAARLSAAGEHDLDEIPLDGVFAKSLKLVEQLCNKPRSHMPPRVMWTTKNVKCDFVFFKISFALPVYGITGRRATRSGS
jgi:hypothetical protein